MITSSNGNIFRVTGALWGNPPDTNGLPSQRPVTPSFDFFLDVRQNKRWREGNSVVAVDIGRHFAHCDVSVMGVIGLKAMQ